LIFCFADLIEETHTHWIVFITYGEIVRNLVDFVFGEVKRSKELSLESQEK